MKEEYLENEEFNILSETYEEAEDADDNNNNSNNIEENAQMPAEEDEDMEQQNNHCHLEKDLQQNTELHVEYLKIVPQDFDAQHDDAMLRKLLKKFQMCFLYPFLKACDITYRSLRYLSVEDINTAIRSVGHRAEFREKLFSWRRKRYRTQDTIIECEKSAQPIISGNQQLPAKAHTIPTGGYAKSTNNSHFLNDRKSFNNFSNLTSNYTLNGDGIPLKCASKAEKRSPSPSTTSAANTLARLSKSFALPRNEENTVSQTPATVRYVDESNIQDSLSELFDDETDSADPKTYKRPKIEAIAGLRNIRINILLNLEKLLDKSLFGPAMKAFYKANGYLQRKHREEIIQTIIDYVIANNIKLHCSDFNKITQMIVEIFPSEEETKEYYFINRKGKRNPMGRLYTKYYNCMKRLRIKDIHQDFVADPISGTAAIIEEAIMSQEKKAQATRGRRSNKTTATATTLPSSSSSSITSVLLNRCSTTTTTTCSSLTECSNDAIISQDATSMDNSSESLDGRNLQIEIEEEEDSQNLKALDDNSVSAIKNYLRCQGIDWQDVKEMWAKTYLSRQEDIEHCTLKDVLQQWPKYLNARGMDLFDIDFCLKFSKQKSKLLHTKWPEFVRKMNQYYTSNVRDEMCKGLYALCKSKPGKDTEDYIFTALLNAIMLPMARYRDALGNRRKVSIADAVDLFAVRLNNLEELDQKREEVAIKYGDFYNEYIPLIVLVGDNSINIHEMYVQFDLALYEMPDFLTALDCCLKIYRVFNLPYPASNEYCWSFIQRYFYEIMLPDDIKSPSMSSLVAYLKI